MINRIKKLLHVAFQNETRSRIILTFRPDHALKSQHALMHAFVNAAGKRIGNKSLIKKWIQNLKQRMMQNSVSDRRFVNVSNLRITDKEAGVRQVSISLGQQIAMKLKDILFQAKLKSLHVQLAPFVFFEVIPCRKKILQRCNLFK